MVSLRSGAWLLALVGGLLLGACSDSAPETSAATADGGAKPPPARTANPVENMVAAVPAGLSARYVGVHFLLGNAPAVQQALPIDIAIVPHEKFASLRARFDSQEGLTLMSGDQLAARKDTEAEQPIKHQLMLMPVSEGVFMITVNIETESSEGTVSRIFSIPVIVAPAAPAAPAAPEAPAPAATEAPAAN